MIGILNQFEVELKDYKFELYLQCLFFFGKPNNTLKDSYYD